MALTLTIPDEVLETLKMPKDRVEEELKKELGFLLYYHGLASMGIARKLAGLTKWEFIEGLAKRGMQRHYTEKELQEDIDYVKGSQ